MWSIEIKIHRCSRTHFWLSFPWYSKDEMRAPAALLAPSTSSTLTGFNRFSITPLSLLILHCWLSFPSLYGLMQRKFDSRKQRCNFSSSMMDTQWGSGRVIGVANYIVSHLHDQAQLILLNNYRSHIHRVLHSSILPAKGRSDGPGAWIGSMHFSVVRILIFFFV